MEHECEICGQSCVCDGDDTGGLPQPDNCPHWAEHRDGDEDAEAYWVEEEN